MVDASIIVATFNRIESLQKLLTSLRRQKGVGSCTVELLVVDNSSTDGTWEYLRKEQTYAMDYSFRPLQESQRGKASALNKGVRAAKGRILVIADDDVEVCAEWLSGHLECYRTGFFDAVQGRVLPGVDWEGRPADPRRIREYNIPIVDYGDKIREIRALTGTNMSFKREVVDRVGFFDLQLGDLHNA